MILGVSTMDLGRYCGMSIPAADVPVVQLSIDETSPLQLHFEIGRSWPRCGRRRALSSAVATSFTTCTPMRGAGIPSIPTTGQFALSGKLEVCCCLAITSPLVHYESLGPDATLSVPTPDHYLPLLYVIGAGAPHEPLSFPVEGVDGGSISMLTVQLG